MSTPGVQLNLGSGVVRQATGASTRRKCICGRCLAESWTHPGEVETCLIGFTQLQSLSSWVGQGFEFKIEAVT